MMKKLQHIPFNPQLVDEIKTIIQEGRQQVAQAVNSGLTATYWQIGKSINEDILKHNRAEYGEQILLSVSNKLIEEFGKGWSVQQLRHCLRFAESFPEVQIVSTLWRQLSWSHFKIIIYRKSIACFLNGQPSAKNLKNWRNRNWHNFR